MQINTRQICYGNGVWKNSLDICRLRSGTVKFSVRRKQDFLSSHRYQLNFKIPKLMIGLFIRTKIGDILKKQNFRTFGSLKLSND